MPQCGGFLERTIESVLAQDYPKIEYIVMDGGSTDGTLDILRRYEGNLRWVSGPDLGTADAINRGFALSRGEIFTYLNADDEYLPGAVSAAVRAFQAEPEASVVYGDAWWVDQAGCRIAPYPCGISTGTCSLANVSSASPLVLSAAKPLKTPAHGLEPPSDLRLRIMDAPCQDLRIPAHGGRSGALADAPGQQIARPAPRSLPRDIPRDAPILWLRAFPVDLRVPLLPGPTAAISFSNRFSPLCFATSKAYPPDCS